MASEEPTECICVCGEESEPPTSNSPPSVQPSLIATAGSFPPSECVDSAYFVTEDDVINKFGSNEPIPQDAMKIITGDVSSITIGKYGWSSEQ